MRHWAKEIDDAFGSEIVPDRDELVDFDGFDELDKKYAVNEFLGKSQPEVYENIKTGTFGSISVIESWAVMKPGAQKFYLAPYLKYLACDIIDDPNEDETVHSFFFYFNEYIRIYGALPLDRKQCKVLLDLIGMLLGRVQRLQPGDTDLREWQWDLAKDLQKLENSLRSFSNC